ncbi:unnamed protein product [Hyaloperonospora brassicae]|uniref:Uncharacterized protein n=1 Tax=Hyaloperonospora brassicae TaxID=162125 RepID=A0AAV0UN58_HYABA|nr:unnamed protein product [Hyaloperonospora brassicae]
MLSRVDNARVFASSDDVVFPTCGRVATSHSRRLEDEALRPSSNRRERVRPCGGQWGDGAAATMELFFGDSGAIWARADCRMGSSSLEVPQVLSCCSRTSADEGGSEGHGTDRRGRCSWAKQEEQERPRRRRTSSRGRPRGPRGDDRWDSSSVVSSIGSVLAALEQEEEVVTAAAAAASEDDDEEEEEKEEEKGGLDGDSVFIVSKCFTASETQNEQTTSGRGGQMRLDRREARRGDEHDELQEGDAAFAVRDTGNLTSVRLSHGSNDLGKEDSNTAAMDSNTAAHGRRKERTSEDALRESRQQRPAASEEALRVLQTDDANEAASRQTNGSSTVDRSVLDEQIFGTKGGAVSCEGKSDNVIVRLGRELQNEKQLVRQQTAYLRDEQDRNQQLRARIEELEAQLPATKDSTRSVKARKASREQGDERLSSEKDRYAQLGDSDLQGRVREADTACGNDDTVQRKSGSQQPEEEDCSLPGDHRRDARTVVGLRDKLDDMNGRLSEFLARVERWKSSSKRKLSNCRKTELPDLMENVWSDFPQYSESLPRRDAGTLNPPSKQLALDSGEQADLIHFLKKRLRQRDDELRQTCAKYVELKELCARQCVREADLQNFINEHRLRGNLPVIRKASNCQPGAASSNKQTRAQDKQHDTARCRVDVTSVPDGDNKMALPSYNKKRHVQANAASDKYADNDEEANGECVMEGKLECSMGTFNKYALPENADTAREHSTRQSREEERKTAGMKQLELQHRCQHQRAERVLAPSSSRTRRVPPSTRAAARHSQSIQQLSRSHLPLLGTCPIGCGSHASYLPAEPRARAAQAANPVTTRTATRALKRAGKVSRPWT